MIKAIGVALLCCAAWQFWVASKIANVNRSQQTEQEKRVRIQRLNKSSRIVQAVVLISVLIFIGFGVQK